MTQTFYTKWQSSVLADAGNYVSKEYNNFQTALLSEISKYAKAVDAAVVAECEVASLQRHLTLVSVIGADR